MQAPTESDISEVAGHIRREKASGLDICFHNLPAVEPPTDYVGAEDFVSRFVEFHAAHVKAAISGLTCPVAALVIDFFGTTLLDVSRDLAVPSYVHFTASAAMYALFLRLPGLHDEVTVEFEEMEGMVDVAGLPPVPPSALPLPLMEKTKPGYTWFVYHGRRFMEAQGVIINTAGELEQSVLAAIADGRCTARTEYLPRRCTHAGFSTATQARAIAHGLERSGHRFLWVLRGPPPAAGTGQPSDANLVELLPEGFLERTKEKGMVWPTRAPQKEILAHAAVGGFVTHSGWNSILESLWFGVPMVPWPLYAEQHLNAITLVASMGVAVAMKVDRKMNNFVEASELERAVKALMDGDSDDGRKARETATELKAVCRKAVEKGGSSYSALGRLSEEMRQGAVPAIPFLP
ncbi:hypothetical protein ACQ4PT_032660 [Festuca glaucescens]